MHSEGCYALCAVDLCPSGEAGLGSAAFMSRTGPRQPRDAGAFFHSARRTLTRMLRSEARKPPNQVRSRTHSSDRVVIQLVASTWASNVSIRSIVPSGHSASTDHRSPSARTIQKMGFAATVNVAIFLVSTFDTHQITDRMVIITRTCPNRTNK